MIQQAGKAPGAQGAEGKSFPSAEPGSAAKWVIERDTSSSEWEACSSSLHSAEGKAGILAVSLPSSAALTAGTGCWESAASPSPAAAKRAARLLLSCRNSLPSSLTQIETDVV